MIEDNIKVALNEIHAEQSLKQETKQFIYNKVYNKNQIDNKDYYRKYYNSRKAMKRIASVVCCIIAVLSVFGYYRYTTPAAVISLDINPSIELEVNMFDKIINVTSYNNEGQAIINKINLKNKNYITAIKEMLMNETIISFLQSDNPIEILVVGKDENISDNMRTCILNEINIDDKNIHCGNWENTTAAHSQGMSCGKYQMYLQLHDKNPSITIEEIKNLTMKEIRQMLQDINNNVNNTTSNENNLNENVNNSSNCGSGQGNGHQHKHGYHK